MAEDLDRDPTRTKTLRDDFRTDLTTRFRALQGAIRQSVEGNDALRLGQRWNAGPDLPPVRDFGFTRDSDRREAFLDQLDEWIDAGVLVPHGREAIKEGGHYTAEHIRPAYLRGTQNANRQLSVAGHDVDDVVRGMLTAQPVHREQLKMLYTRTYDQLEDITSSMSTDIGRVLSESFGEGVNPKTAADRLTKEVRDMKNTRAETLARTEFMNAHHSGAVNRYEQYGVQQVDILTSGPCDRCAEVAAGAPYPVNQVHSLLPVHPRCICGLAPVASSIRTNRRRPYQARPRARRVA